MINEAVRDLVWLEELPVGSLCALIVSTYACKDGLICNGFSKQCMIVEKNESWCYLGWNDELSKHHLVSINILYKEAKWDLLVRPYVLRLDAKTLPILDSAIITLEDIDFLMR